MRLPVMVTPPSMTEMTSTTPSLVPTDRLTLALQQIEKQIGTGLLYMRWVAAASSIGLLVFNRSLVERSAKLQLLERR
jgi:hypothetical protein